MTIRNAKYQRRLAALVTAVAVALGGVLVTATPAQAYTTTCTNAGCPNSGAWNSARWTSWWGNDVLGTNTPGANCTNYAAWRLIGNGLARPSINLGNANTWDDRARQMGFPVNGTPAVGSIAQWDSGAYGHVAYVEAVNGNTVTISESNWNGTWLGQRHMAVNEVSNFIHFKDVNQPEPPAIGSRVIATVDFNGDGNSDVFRIRPDGTLVLYTGNGQGGWADGNGAVIGSGWNVFTKVIAPGDFDGDGKADLIGIKSTGDMILFTGNGAGNWANGDGITVGTGWEAFASVVAPGDFNGDGKVDIIGAKPDGSLYLYTGNGQGGWADGTGALIGASWNQFSQVISPRDFDGDGKSDIVTMTPNGNVSLYTGDGQGYWANPAGAQIGSGFSIFSALTSAGDFDGDAKADVLGVKSNGDLFLYQGNGSGGWKTGSGVLIGVGW